MLQRWEQQYRDIRLQIRRATIDTFGISKILKFTSASMQKGQVKAIEQKQKVRDLQRHNQSKAIAFKIKELQNSKDARPLFQFKQQMQSVYNTIAQKQEKLLQQLQYLTKHYGQKNKKNQKQKLQSPQRRITQKDQQVLSYQQNSQNQVDKNFPYSQNQQSVVQQKDIQFLSIQQVNQKLFKLGKFLGWKAGDHLQFMQILAKHRNNLVSQKFTSQASNMLALPLRDIIEHAQNLQYKNKLQQRKKQIIRQHKQRKNIQKLSQAELDRLKKQENKIKQRQRSLKMRKESLQKKQQIQQFRKKNPIKQSIKQHIKQSNIPRPIK